MEGPTPQAQDHIGLPTIARAQKPINPPLSLSSPEKKKNPNSDEEEAENGVGEQGSELGGESGEQRHGGERWPGGGVRGADGEVGEPAEGHRGSGGREGLARRNQQANEELYVVVEAEPLRRRRRSRLASTRPSLPPQGHLRRRASLKERRCFKGR